MNAPFHIAPARAAELPAVLRLLLRNGLPEAKLADYLNTLVVARRGDEVVGSAALELYPDGALLRSVAVDARFRGAGLGQALTRAALDLAEARGAARVFLLTTTAEQFFPRFGFVPVRREDVPPGVRTSDAFTATCPASATVLACTLAQAPKKRVLFVCTHNSARSQMAEGLLRMLAGDRYDVCSAGTEPRGVNPLAVRAMQELGIDLTGHRSEHVDRYLDPPADVVVTVCDAAREACPFVPARERTIHHSFRDPSAATGTDEERLAVFRQVRDEIRAWLEETFVPQYATP